MEAALRALLRPDAGAMEEGGASAAELAAAVLAAAAV